MKHAILVAGLALLWAGCADDPDARQPEPVITDMRFAAALDPLEGTRAALVGGQSVWDVGDRVGITALIDGTPFIPNIPYTVDDAATFSYLTPVDEAILWNESVVGERTFFACYPYDESAEQGYRFAVPAEQTVTDGRNSVRPVLIGRGRSVAELAEPVALRFEHLFPVLELSFAPFEETALDRVVLEPAEDARIEGSLTATGNMDANGRVTVEPGDADRITVRMEGTGLALDQGASVQIPLGRFTLTGGLQVTATATDGRVFGMKAFADEPFASCVTDDGGAFVRARYIPLLMPLEVVSDETNEVFFRDDFDWVRDAPKWSDFTGGGWPTVTAANSPTGKANYFSLDQLDDFDRLGYTAQGAAQARAEGYVALGISGSRGELTTPPLEAIGAEPADLMVSCYLATYASANGTPDTGAGRMFPIRVSGPGTIGRDGGPETEVLVDNTFGWKKYWVIVYGATAQTRITFGRAEEVKNGRALLDRILIGRAIKGATAGSRQVADDTEPFIRLLEGADGLELSNEENASGSFVVQSNRAWTATADADWLAIDLASANQAGIAHRIEVRATSLNRTGVPRTGTVTIAAAGAETTASVTVTQGSEVTLLADDFAWATGGTAGGILDDALTASTAIGKNGAIIGSWPQEWLDKGYEGVRVYAKAGQLTLGIAGNHGYLDIPALEAAGDGMDVVIEYDVLEYKNAAETGKSVFSIAEGEGRIRSLEGNYVPAGDDAYTALAADGRSYSYYCGDYGKWEDGARWHRIRVVAEGVTSATRFRIAGNGANSRFWLDNLCIVRKLD